MSLTQPEAKAHLEQSEQMQKRSAQAFGYRKASPHLLLWGAIWLVGYGACDIYPHLANAIWLVLGTIGFVLSALVGRASGGNRPASWRFMALFVLVFGFLFALYAILSPLQPMQYAAIPPLLVGVAYMVAGLWAGFRMAALGFLIMLLTVSGYFCLPSHFLLWMACLGGGALILGGLWLRSV